MSKLPKKQDFISQYPFCLFAQRSKKKDFLAVEKSFSKARSFLENDNGQIFLGFGKTKAQVDLFLFIIQVALKWGGTVVFSNGNIETKPWKLIDVLACYKRSIGIKNKDKYCRVPVEVIPKKRGGRITIELVADHPRYFPEEPNIEKHENRFVPCRMIAGQVWEFTKEEFEFLGERTRCNGCPNFKTS